MKNVLLCYEAANYASRCVIMGVQKFITQKGDWNVRVVSFPEVLTADMVRRAPNGGCDGILLPLIAGPDVAEALHYEHVDFELKTTNKMIRVAAKFKEARNEKKWKLYVFDIEDYNQYYI